MMDFTKNVISRFVCRIIALIASIALSIVIARVLGPTGKGVYAMIFLISSLLYLLGSFGIDTANTYFTGKKSFKLKFLVSNSLFFGLCNGIGLILIFLLFYYFFGNLFFKGINPSFIYLVLITVPFTLITNYLAGILLGKQKIKELNWIMVFTSLANLVGVVLLLLIFKKGILSLILLSILISIINSLISISLVSKFAKIKFSFYPKAFKLCFNFGIKGYLADIIMFLNYRLDMVLVNFFMNITQVGFYSLAVNIAEMMWYLPKSIFTVLFSEVASQKGNSGELTARVCRINTFILILLSISVILFARLGIKILYGSNFLPSLLPLLLLIPGIIFIGMISPIAGYRIGIGQIKYAPKINIITLIINISLNLILIPKLGISGAAIATSISYLGTNIMESYLFKKFSGISWKDTFVIKKGDFIFFKNLLFRIISRN
jgi:O-antigen/teichoic acid export membrane protein